MSPRLRSVSTGLAVVFLFALPLLPEILGARILVFRDAQITHWPWRRVAMAALESGRVPFLNEAASGTEPLLANPNAVLLYPTVLLEKVLPPASAFNLHYLLHVLWAFFGARLLASRLGVSPGGSWFAGAAYAFSGMMLSYGSAFFNSSASASWVPWCAAAALAIPRAASGSAAARGSAATGLAFALQLLAGEPAISVLTAVFVVFVVLLEIATAPRRERLGRLGVSAAGGVAVGVIGLAFAAPLLVPLQAIFSLTYRGQHLYSESAFGAAPFLPWRAVEWLFPRFAGDPALLGSGASWTHAIHNQELVYIWCVSFGVLPLLAVALGALRREFWDRRTIAIAAMGVTAWLFSFGFALPFYRLIFAMGFFRRLRYPIKFYLLTTIAVALLAGFASDRFREGRPARRQGFFLGAVIALFAAAFFLAHSGGALDAFLRDHLILGGVSAEGMLDAFHTSIRSDAVLGAITAAILGGVLLSKRLPRPGFALALLCAALALPWGLPLFVSASTKEMTRRPAILSAMRGTGRLYAPIDIPSPDFEALEPGRKGLPRFEKVARMLTEELVPATGEPFGLTHLFDNDPDGSYGFYNRLVSEATIGAAPGDRSRLLRAFGARWVFASETDKYPLFHPVTGIVVGGQNFVLHVLDDPVAEVRWAGRADRRASLSAAIVLVRSERFRPETDVVLPGRQDRDAAATLVPGARLTLSRVAPEEAEGIVDAQADGHVVFARTYFSAWKARVDGAPTSVLVANARDLAVAVPAGRHTFQFTWDRAPFHRGVIAQAAVFAVLLVFSSLLAFTALSRRRPFRAGNPS